MDGGSSYKVQRIHEQFARKVNVLLYRERNPNT